MMSWVAGIAQSILGGVVLIFLLKLVPEDNIGAWWHRHWPEIVGLVFVGFWLVGHRIWAAWSHLQRRLRELEQQSSDSHIRQITYNVLAENEITPKITRLDDRIGRLEAWKNQGGGDTLEAFARRVKP